MFGGCGGGGDNEPKLEEKNALQFEDLESFFDKKLIECLNADPNFPVESCLFDKSEYIFTKSDTDEQLIINIGFNTPVRIHHLIIRSRRDASAPKTLKIFVNQLNMDFNTCQDIEPTQTIELKEQDFLKQTDLRFVNFQNVKNITFFFENNFGADQTIINCLRLIGSTKLETNDEAELLDKGQRLTEFLMMVSLQTLTKDNDIGKKKFTQLINSLK